MGVNLIYRTPYKHRNNKFYKKFNQTGILELFTSFWDNYSDDETEFVDRVFSFLGEHIYGLWGVFRETFSNEDELVIRSKEFPPKDYEQLLKYLKDSYHNEIKHFNKSWIQLLTDDDELGLAFYIFTDEYAKDNPSICSYLMHPNWELPTLSSKKNSFEENIIKKSITANNDNGVTYICFFSSWAGDNLSNRNLLESVTKIEGVRLPNLNVILKKIPCEELSYELVLLRSQIIDNSVTQTLKNYSLIPKFYIKHWHLGDYDCSEINNDLIKEYYQVNKEEIDKITQLKFRGTDGNELPLSKFQDSDHLIQASIHTETWKEHPTSDLSENVPLFDHIIIFDDLWASANSNLAKSILNYATKWDVLK